MYDSFLGANGNSSGMFPMTAGERRLKRTTDSHHAWPVAPNIINQDFTASKPDEKWGADIYVWTRQGWLYLAVVIDLFARRVVGWAIGDRLHRELALAALRKAVAMRRPSKGLIHHSDRGANIARSTTKPNCSDMTCASPYPERAIATTMPWSRRSSKR